MDTLGILDVVKASVVFEISSLCFVCQFPLPSLPFEAYRFLVPLFLIPSFQFPSFPFYGFPVLRVLVCRFPVCHSHALRFQFIAPSLVIPVSQSLFPVPRYHFVLKSLVPQFPGLRFPLPRAGGLSDNSIVRGGPY